MNQLDSHVLHQPEDDVDEGPAISLVDLLTWVGEGKRLIGTVTGMVVVLALVLAFMLDPVFTARTTLLPPSAQQPSASAAALAALGSLGGLAGGITAKTPDELYVNLLKSDTVQRTLATRFDLYKRYKVDTYEVMRTTMPRYVRISSDKKSGVITLEVDDRDPKFSADLANAYSAELTKLLSRLAVSEAQQRRVFFDQQLKETKENLVKAEQALRTVQEKSGMIVLDQQAEAIIKAVAELKTKIIEREVRLKVMRTSTTAQNPDVQLLMSELSALRGELARMESSVPATAKAASAAGGGIDIPIGKLPAAAIDYVRAAREVKFQETMLASMLRQYEVAKLDEAKEGPALQQVDVAQPPDRKSKPSRALIVLGAALAALLLSSFFVILRRYRALVREQDPEAAQAWARMAAAWRLRRKA
ncbi:Wzz/FepE/Etk N-terminal domain-containing protein [Piscinibacter gummiphilus]|uniref:Wzz/FepE/Etk N-terminal domain-containing protein n=1 Tax=Piscinibacter gummiphilus TaxID=946333 RepID=A0ABZ0CSZ4_9BURK|nr:Wzz/FepE/Etk N-terminal domain-containing protein [Piscinibacter gummiphilus]WOB08079.1 Wzz/FepE/Etk N-terminal domain-containing protein [Piscinibacter gummiphilus]